MGNKRAIVSVATGDFYCRNQRRMVDTFRPHVDTIVFIQENVQATDHVNFSKGIDLILWKDCLPVGSSSHNDSPYGFKIHAINNARQMGYESILWLDSAAYAMGKDISPIFEKIEAEGYYVMSHIDPLQNWVGEDILLSFQQTKETITGLNLPSGSCYGFDLSSGICNGFSLFHTLRKSEAAGHFKSIFRYHRHDEAVLALCMHDLSLPVFTFDKLFQSDGPECLIRNGDFGPNEQAKYAI